MPVAIKTKDIHDCKHTNGNKMKGNCLETNETGGNSVGGVKMKSYDEVNKVSQTIKSKFSSSSCLHHWQMQKVRKIASPPVKYADLMQIAALHHPIVDYTLLHLTYYSSGWLCQKLLVSASVLHLWIMIHVRLLLLCLWVRGKVAYFSLKLKM